MTYELRKKEILSALTTKELVDVIDIAESLEVSPITIRRDFDKLAAEGLLRRTHGGAVRNNNSSIISFDAKSIQNKEAKEHICKLAATLIEDGDSIFIDCGSTTFGLCPHIREKKITVITNSLPVFNALVCSEVSLNLIGGSYDKKRMAIHGEMAVEHIKKYYVNKAFVGVNGISQEHGLTANSEYESSITKAMIENSQKAILLCDDSKIEKRSYYSFASLNTIDCLITNKKSHQLMEFKNQNPRLEILF